MRRLVALTIVATLASGCSYTSSKRTAIAGAVLSVASVGAFVEVERSHTNAGLVFFPVGVALLSVGAVLVTGGLIGMHHYPEGR